MGKRIRIGDVVEIPTAKGLSYAQMTNKDKKWGALIRVLKGAFEARPQEEVLAEISQSETVFVTFFPLQAAVSRGVFEIVGNGVRFTFSRSDQRYTLDRENRRRLDTGKDVLMFDKNIRG